MAQDDGIDSANSIFRWFILGLCSNVFMLFLQGLLILMAVSDISTNSGFQFLRRPGTQLISSFGLGGGAAWLLWKSFRKYHSEEQLQKDTVAILWIWTVVLIFLVFGDCVYLV